MNFVVLYDACVLYPAPLRDILLEIAISELVAAKWTTTIHDEWMRNLLADRPELKGRLEKTRVEVGAKIRKIHCGQPVPQIQAQASLLYV